MKRGRKIGQKSILFRSRISHQLDFLKRTGSEVIIQPTRIEKNPERQIHLTAKRTFNIKISTHKVFVVDSISGNTTIMFITKLKNANTK